MKKVLLIIFSCSLQLNFVLNRTTTKPFNPIYSLHFDTHNNITGTGNKFRDLVYNQLCINMHCETNCCEGYINEMRCGVQMNCDKYIKYKRLTVIILGVVLSIVVVSWILMGVARCLNKENNKTSLTIIIVIICLIYLPITLFVLMIYFTWKMCCKDTTPIQPTSTINVAPTNLEVLEKDSIKIDNEIYTGANNNDDQKPGPSNLNPNEYTNAPLNIYYSNNNSNNQQIEIPNLNINPQNLNTELYPILETPYDLPQQEDLK